MLVWIDNFKWVMFKGCWLLLLLLCIIMFGELLWLKVDEDKDCFLEWVWLLLFVLDL